MEVLACDLCEGDEELVLELGSQTLRASQDEGFFATPCLGRGPAALLCRRRGPGPGQEQKAFVRRLAALGTTGAKMARGVVPSFRLALLDLRNSMKSSSILGLHAWICQVTAIVHCKAGSQDSNSVKSYASSAPAVPPAQQARAAVRPEGPARGGPSPAVRPQRGLPGSFSTCLPADACGVCGVLGSSLAQEHG